MGIIDLFISIFCCVLLIGLTYLYLCSGGDDMIGVYAGGVGGFITVFLVLGFLKEGKN